MKVIQDRKNPQLSVPAGTGWRALRTVTMHPDDFTAHLAWVTAKRVHER